MKLLARYEFDYREHNPVAGVSKRIAKGRYYAIDFDECMQSDIRRFIQEKDHDIVWPVDIFNSS